MKFVTHHFSANLHPNSSLSTLEQGMLTMAQNECFLSPKPVPIWDTPHPSLEHRLAGTASPLLPEGTLNNFQVKISPQGSWRFIKATLFPFFKIVVTTNKLAVALVTALSPNTQRNRACAYQAVKNLER